MESQVQSSLFNSHRSNLIKTTHSQTKSINHPQLTLSPYQKYHFQQNVKTPIRYQLAKRYSDYNRDTQNQRQTILKPSSIFKNNHKKILSSSSYVNLSHSINGKNKNNTGIIHSGITPSSNMNKSQFSRSPLPSIIPQQSFHNKNYDSQSSENKPVLNIFRNDIPQRMSYDQIQKAKDYQIVGRKQIKNHHTRVIKKRQNNNKRTQSIISISKFSTVKSSPQQKNKYMNKQQVVNIMSPLKIVQDSQEDIQGEMTKKNYYTDRSNNSNNVFSGQMNNNGQISSMFKVKNKIKKYNKLWDLQKQQLDKIDSNPHSYVRKPTDIMNHAFSLQRIRNMNTQKDDITNFASLTSSLLNSPKKFCFTQQVTNESGNTTCQSLNTTLGNNINNMSLTLNQRNHISILDRVDSYRKKVQQMQKLTLKQQQKHTSQNIWPLTLRSQLTMKNYYKDYAFKKTHKIIKNGFALKGQEKLIHELNWINNKNNHVFQAIDKQRIKIQDVLKQNDVSSCKANFNYEQQVKIMKKNNQQIRLNPKTCR